MSDMLDHQRAATIQGQLTEEEQSDAALGMQNLMKASKDPKMLAESMIINWLLLHIFVYHNECPLKIH
jgi:hypothetical protein